MVGGDQIDVADSLLGQGQKTFHQGGKFQVFSQMFAGELVVLAEEASAGASREEESAAAVGAHQGRLFPEVGFHGGDVEPVALSAESPLAGGAVHAAASGAEGAVAVLREIGGRHGRGVPLKRFSWS